MDINLELLVELQNVDNEITQIEALVNAFPDQLSAHSAALATAKAEHDAFRKRLEESNKERLAKEKEVEMKNAGIAKSRIKLSDVKTNQEYTAALAEIENMKAAISKLEEEQLEIMEKLDTAKADEKTLKEKVAVEEKSFAQFKSEKEAELEKVKGEAEKHRAIRAEIAVKIRPDLLAQYDRIFSQRENLAVAKLKDGFCMACHQMVLPQMALEVRTNKAIHKCPHCQRFLYPVLEPKKEEAVN